MALLIAPMDKVMASRSNKVCSVNEILTFILSYSHGNYCEESTVK